MTLTLKKSRFNVMVTTLSCADGNAQSKSLEYNHDVICKISFMILRLGGILAI